MKKQILNIVGAIAIGSFLLVSCSESHDEASHDNTEMTHEHAATYQCPMDCEDGKTYDAAGKCPVCGMDLAEVEHQH